MEITRYISKVTLERFLIREINLMHLIENSQRDKDELFSGYLKMDIPIKITIPDKILKK